MGMDMDKLLQQVEQMQGEMQKAQDELASQTVEATAGGGMVTVKANGAGEIQEVKIDPKAIDPNDPEMLEDMILAAARGSKARRSGGRRARRARAPRARAVVVDRAVTGPGAVRGSR
jgi:nucleoid-associated protein EbfC